MRDYDRPLLCYSPGARSVRPTVDRTGCGLGDTMKRITTHIAGAAVIAAAAMLLPGAAAAQGACPEGRTASGQCVNPGLAQGMQQSALLFSQPKISFTTLPILPADDFIFRYPNQLIPDQLKPAPVGTPIAGGGGNGGLGGAVTP